MAETRDYLQLFLADRPLLDVRAPVEFAQGAFPTAVNLPLLTDDERRRVGTCYKRHGRQAAIDLGHRLVDGTVKTARVEGWQAFFRHHPRGHLYCFRGGLRSKIAQQWLAEAGCNCLRIGGGYKAMRRFLLDALTSLPATLHPLVIGGRTGVGKTQLLKALPPTIDPLDLEGLANHRGSGFGRRVTPQPSQIDFEHALAIALLKRVDRDPTAWLAVEDESRLIGSRALPQGLFQAMACAPIVLLEADLETRIEATLREYIFDMAAAFAAVGVHPPTGDAPWGFAGFRAYLLDSLDRIRKRLGGERHARLRRLILHALERQGITGDIDLHRRWIRPLLVEYYDPMYDYQLQSKAPRVVFRGDRRAVLDWLAALPRPGARGS
ncbi:MAG: tRNA 2-selenouridine(34) synthase MnmH [Candidatus Competibacterales bacterium]